MAERFIVIGGSLFISFGAFYLCKLSSAYYDELRYKAFIRIRSNVICYLFIAQAIKSRGGRLVYVAPQDEHKMTLLGLLSHLIVDRLAIRCVFLSVQYGIFQSITLEVVRKPLAYMVCAALISAIISTINQSKVR